MNIWSIIMAIKVETKKIRDGSNLINFFKDDIYVACYYIEAKSVRFYNTLSLTKDELRFILSKL